MPAGLAFARQVIGYHPRRTTEAVAAGQPSITG